MSLHAARTWLRAATRSLNTNTAAATAKIATAPIHQTSMASLPGARAHHRTSRARFPCDPAAFGGVRYDGAMSEETTHFGYREVPENEKAKLVGRVFTSVAAKYDVMNDLMSFG